MKSIAQKIVPMVADTYQYELFSIEGFSSLLIDNKKIATLFAMTQGFTFKEARARIKKENQTIDDYMRRKNVEGDWTSNRANFFKQQLIMAQMMKKSFFVLAKIKSKKLIDD